MDAENRCILNCGGVRHETYKGWQSCIRSRYIRSLLINSNIMFTIKLISGSRVGQVGSIDSCGQVGDLDPFASK